MRTGRILRRDTLGRLHVDAQVVNAAGAVLGGAHPIVVAMRAVIERANHAFAQDPEHLPGHFFGVVTSDSGSDPAAVAEAAAQWWKLAGLSLVALTDEAAQPYLQRANAWVTTAWKGSGDPARVDWSIVFPSPWGHEIGLAETSKIMAVRSDEDLELGAKFGSVGPVGPFPTAGAPTEAEVAAAIAGARAVLGAGATNDELVAFFNARLAELPVVAQHPRDVIEAAKAAVLAGVQQLPPTEPAPPPVEEPAESTTSRAAPYVGSALGGLVGGLVGQSIPGKHNAAIGGTIGAIVGALVGATIKE